MDRGTWQAAVHGVTKSQIRLSNRTHTHTDTHTHTHTHTHTQHRVMKWKSQTKQVPENPNGLRPMIQRKIYVQESFPFSLNLPFQLYLLRY